MSVKNQATFKKVQEPLTQILKFEGPETFSVPMNPLIEQLLGKLLKIEAELEERKALYEKYNETVLELVKLGFVEAELNGQHFTLKDNFARGNTGWTSAAVRRFEVEAISSELHQKRLAKAEKKNEKN